MLDGCVDASGTTQLRFSRPPCIRRTLSKSKKQDLARKEGSSHARLFDSARRIEIRRKRSAAQIDRQRNRRGADRCLFLRPLKLAVDAVWHSGKARAQQTGELLAEAVGARDRVVQREGLGPKDQVATTKEAIEQTGGDVMIVGHLPFLGKLVALLVTGSEKNEIVEFQFGSIVCIELRDDGKWKVAWMITPALLHD